MQLIQLTFAFTWSDPAIYILSKVVLNEFDISVY